MALKEGKKIIRKNNDFQDFFAEEFGSIYMVRNQIITKKRKKKEKGKYDEQRKGEIENHSDLDFPKWDE